MASRKERRAAAFKKGSEARKEVIHQKQIEKAAEDAKVVKKSKAPPRFLLFVGNLPFNTTEEDIRKHFGQIKPAAIRWRPDKGIAFLEFIGDHASADMHQALRFHHSLFGKRKINVELSAGGGGNSKARLEKIRTKNDALQEELAERITAEKERKVHTQKSKVQQEENPEESARRNNSRSEGKQFVHPSRLSQIN